MLLVTGITGHTGGYFLQNLIKNKYEGPIRCIIRESSNTSLIDNSGLNIEKVIGDIRDEAFLDKCMKGVETIIHIVNIRHTLRIIKLAIENKVNRVICVHTTGVYSKFKVASEEYINIESKLQEVLSKAEINVTILKPTMIYGDLSDHNMSKFIKMIDSFRFFPVIDNGRGLIQPVNARDLGKAYYDVLMMPVKYKLTEYILSGDRPIQMKEAFTLISNCLGKKTTFFSVPMYFGVFLANGLKILTFKKIDYVEKVQRMGESRSFSHEEAYKDFGYKPEPFEIGITREVQEYKNSR